jgi:4-amino-4-deoxy-L-arabinose transferase-like glycosyltransferase
MKQKNTTHAMDAAHTAVPSSRSGVRRMLLTWFTAWEIYPIVLVAAFLRFYQLSFTEFDTDQAVLWNMARVALAHGLIPANGNLASIGTVNPPAFIYILMAVGIFTGNPLAGAILVALLNVIAVILTYAFTRRYYGRLAGFVAASLTATAVLMLLYSRFIWQPNILPPLLVLYMWALFRGAVARKTGWFAPAVLLLALALQLSGSSIYLLPALVIALVLGYKTLRWRDLALGVVLVALLFSTYLLWEAATGYADIPLLLGASGAHAMIDNQALSAYLRFLSSYSNEPTDPRLFFTQIFPLMYLHQLAMLVLIFASFALLLLGLFWKKVQLRTRGEIEQSTISAPVSANASFWRRLWDHWNVFIASPQRRGLLLLLAWQLLPLLLLSRHSIDLRVHYFLVLMPGPFILLGLLVSQVTTWCAKLPNHGKVLSQVIPALALLLILVQTLGGVAWLVDNTDGNQPNTTDYNTLYDLQAAVQTADQLAHVRHFRHVYIDTDARTVDALNYLAGQMQTPHTLINSNNSHCLLLPDATQGPAVMLLGPTEELDAALLTRFAEARLLSKPPRLGGAPFHIYLIQPVTGTTGAVAAKSSLTLEQSKPVLVSWRNPSAHRQPVERLLATIWRNQTQRPANVDSWWTYHFAATYAGHGTHGQRASADCQLTSLVPGEQLLVPFRLPANSNALPTSLAISGTIANDTPYVLSYGPLHFQTLREQSSTYGTIQGTT